MKDIIIFGNRDFARLLKYYLESDDSRKVTAFTVNEKYIDEKEKCGLPVCPFEIIEEEYSPDKYEILIAIGNSRMNDVRKQVFYDIKEKGYGVASYIHSSCNIHSQDIGEGNIMLENCLVYPYSKIGCGNLMWDHVVINHDCEVGNFNTFAGYSDMCGYVHIGNNCFFGQRCVLNNYMEVADYTLVGAVAYAKGKTKPYDVVVPARSVILEHKKSTDFM